MWDKITVGKFQQLYDIIQGQNFEHEVERKVHLLACLDDKPVEYYEDMKFTELQKHLPRVAALSSGDVPAVPAPKELTVKGRVYKIVYDFRDLYAGQFIDAQSLAKNPAEQVMNLNKTLASICLPVVNGKVQKYGAVPFDEVADDMLDVPITQAIAIANFFFEAWKRFLKVIPGYLGKKMKKRKTLTQTEQMMFVLALQTDGDGSLIPAE